MKRLLTAILLFIFWVLLSFDAVEQAGDIYVWAPSDLIVGAVASLFVAFILAAPVVASPIKFLNPVRWLALFVYLWTFLYNMILSGVNAAYFVMHSETPIKPGVVRLRTRLASPAARAFLANTMNLRPGLLAVDVTDDGFVQVHMLSVDPARMREEAMRLVGSCEDLVERVMG